MHNHGPSTDPAAAADRMASDEKWMRLALDLARQAGERDEVPVGAVIVSDSGEILAERHNRTILNQDPTAHAEILAIRAAAEHIGNYRIIGATLFVTVEPCAMCMGAAVHARLSRVVFGCPDPKWGAAGSLYDFSADERLNHRILVTSGVLLEECRGLMQDFFRKKR